MESMGKTHDPSVTALLCHSHTSIAQEGLVLHSSTLSVGLSSSTKRQARLLLIQVQCVTTARSASYIPSHGTAADHWNVSYALCKGPFIPSSLQLFDSAMNRSCCPVAK